MTLQAFLEKPNQYLKAINVTNFNDVFKAPDITIGEIKRININVIKSAIISQIGYVLVFIGKAQYDGNGQIINSYMNAFQISTTVDFIIEKFYYLKLEDLKLCFKKAMMGEYGKMYNHIDGQIILNWITKYDKAREEFIQSLPNDNLQVSQTDEDISREEYKEILLAKMAGGDLWASLEYMPIAEVDNFFNSIKGECSVYKYNQIHKFNNKLKCQITTSITDDPYRQAEKGLH